MKLPLLPLLCFAAASSLPFSVARAESVLFEIGTFNNNNTDFEQESNDYNDAQYYVEAGDYSLTQGGSGMGTVYEGTTPEILQDGAGAENWAISKEGFPRALVPGRDVVDIFFQMTAEEAASDSLLFETTLFGLGANSSHDVALYLNNVAIERRLKVRGNTPLKIYIPRNLPGIMFHEGANVLTVRRTGGGPVIPVSEQGVDNPWIQFDALKLTANVTSPTELIWQVGTFDNSQGDFEQESNDFNMPQFYAMPGDYSGLKGAAGPGGTFAGTEAEAWNDGGSLDGFPRALVPGRPAVDIYFKLTPAQAQKNFLALHTILFSQGTNSSHDVRAYLNGTPVAIGSNITSDLQVDVLIPRLGATAQGYGPVFNAGENVLSLVRAGGGPVNPEGENSPWIQFDAVSLTTAEKPATTSGLQAYRTIFSAGYFDNGIAEFEQESNNYNNAQFYFAPGDYSGVQGGSGVGEVWEGPGGEIWQDGPTADTWNQTQQGFPRAWIVDRPVIDLFFQEENAAAAKAYMLTTKIYGASAGTTHDFEFSINGGTPFHTLEEVSTEAYVAALIPPSEVMPGPNVISMRRTGGVEAPAGTWVVLDQVELISQAASVSLPVEFPAFRLTNVTRNAAGAVSLNWESVPGGIYQVQTSSSLAAASWQNLSDPVNANGASASFTDSTAATAGSRRFYRVLRTQ